MSCVDIGSVVVEKRVQTCCVGVGVRRWESYTVLFLIFVIVSPCFLLILSLIPSGIDWIRQWWWWVGCTVRALEDCRWKSEDFDHFRPFGRAPSLTALRWANIGSSSHLIDCRFLTLNIECTQGIVRVEWLWDWGGVRRSVGCRVSFGRLVVFDRFSICLYEIISRLFSTVKDIIRCSFERGTLWSPWMGAEVVYRFRIAFLGCFDGTLFIHVRSIVFFALRSHLTLFFSWK